MTIGEVEGSLGFSILKPPVSVGLFLIGDSGRLIWTRPDGGWGWPDHCGNRLCESRLGSMQGHSKKQYGQQST
jgi:hypothetical protein